MSVDRHARGPRCYSEEDGVALVGVLLAVVVLFGLSVVFVATATFESRSTAGSQGYETAIHVAEGAIDDLIPAINFDEAYYSSDDANPDGFARPTDRAELIALGESADRVVRFAEGEGFAIRPVADINGVPQPDQPLNEIWAVGWVPSREDPQRIRAVRIEFDRFRYRPEFGLFTGGPLTVSGGTQITGNFGNVHANDEATATSGDYRVDGSFTWTGSGQDVNCDPEPNSSPPVIGACHGDAQPQPEPQISAREIHRLQSQAAAPWFDLCPPAGGVPATVRPWTAAGPCTGDPPLWTSGDSHHFRGWRYHQGEWKTHQTIHTGVYYVHHRNANVGSMEEMRAAAVIAQEDPNDDGAGSGHIRVTGQAKLKSALAGLVLVADRDIVMTGESQLEGLVAANEQIRVAGEVRITGAVLAQDEKDTVGSLITESSVEGEMEIFYDDELDVPLTGVIRITSWGELRP